ncbi:ParA family protein [Patescibacteria group bacterium]|nr:ParA family protein [Patescibacteria group bacterium]
MARIISVVNQKGGVGKTTTSINLAVYLAALGKYVLLVDLDPQANATSGIGINYNELKNGLYEVLSGSTDIRSIIQQHDLDGLKIAPATSALAGASVELVNIDRREFRLLDVVDQVRHEFDYIIIDSPPSLGLLTINGLVAADEILIPVQAEYFALEGLGQLMNTINLIKENIKPEVKVLGAVLTMYDSRQKLSEQVMHELYQYFPDKIFRSAIPRNVRLAESPSFGKSILHYDPKSKGAKAYERLAKELLEMHENYK